MHELERSSSYASKRDQKTGRAENFGTDKRYYYLNDSGPDVVSCDDKRERFVIGLHMHNVDTRARAHVHVTRTRTQLEEISRTLAQWPPLSRLARVSERETDRRVTGRWAFFRF